MSRSYRKYDRLMPPNSSMFAPPNLLSSNFGEMGGDLEIVHKQPMVTKICISIWMALTVLAGSITPAAATVDSNHNNPGDTLQLVERVSRQSLLFSPSISTLSLGRSAPVLAGHPSATGILQVDELLIDESFEAGSLPPAGWSEMVNNHSYNWEISSSYPYSGNNAAIVEFDNNQDEWLLSPVINLAEASLSFWSYGSVYWCRDTFDYCDLRVWIVVGAVGGGDDIYLGEADGSWPSDWTWSQGTFDLTPFLPGGPFQIGFEYIGDDGADIMLDDITLDATESSMDIFLPLVLVSHGVPTSPPASPTSLVASAASPYTIDLTWSDNANNEAGYTVERSPDGSTWSQVATLPANSSNWQDSGLYPETACSFRVRAFNGVGFSAFSNIASANTLSESTAVCNGDLEQGSACWTEFSTQGWDLIIDSDWPAGISPTVGAGWPGWAATMMTSLIFRIR